MAYKEQLQENNARINAITETLANKFAGAIKVEGTGVNGGYLRYVSETGNAETVLPDTEVNSESTNIPTSNAVSNYVAAKVAELVGSAPETLDTLEEVARAIEENDTVVDALNNAIGNKADKTSVPQFTATQLDDGSYSLSITTPTTEA